MILIQKIRTIKIWQVALALIIAVDLSLTAWSLTTTDFGRAHGVTHATTASVTTAYVIDASSHVQRPSHRKRHWPWGMTPALMVAPSRVATCEEGGWWSDGSDSHGIKHWGTEGPTYWGNLGWSTGLFAQMRKEMGWRYRGFPLRGDLATPREQARAMLFFVRHHNGGYWPDQAGCTGGY